MSVESFQFASNLRFEKSWLFTLTQQVFLSHLISDLILQIYRSSRYTRKGLSSIDRIWITVRYRPRPHTYHANSTWITRANSSRQREDASNHPVPITRDRGLGSKDGRQVFAESNGSQSGEGRGGRASVRGFMRSRHLRVGVVARRD